MGIYDREYYRREGPSFLGAITRHGIVCKWLIAINIVLLFLQAATDSGRRHLERDEDGELVVVEAKPAFSVTEAFQMDAEKVMQGQVWRLVTYAFLHAGVWHIFFNMIFLWWFGSQMEDLYGSREFLTFYLVAAVLGGIAFQLTYLARGGSYLCIGASGAVTAVLVLFALHYPRQIVYLAFFLPVPIWLLVAFQVGQDFLGFIQPSHAGNTAVTVHLAGALFAFLYYKSEARLLNFVPDLSRLRKLRRPSNLRIYREEAPRPVAVGSPKAENTEHFEAKLDAVLEKVARFGQGSLTESERELLMRASEVYKRRRT